MQSDPRLIAALDFPTAEAAKQAVEEIGDAVSYYKVGMELYYGAGNEMIRFLKERGKKVFLDLKLQDIPNTVAGA
ncbi:MAG: orotidine 5'-phosphate decarboxylase, partial [Acidaminococcaceae bacterium]|nr:orotidine 5'-phosphate decarboxylase [Acidaminococcaceae bacterium]